MDSKTLTLHFTWVAMVLGWGGGGTVHKDAICMSVGASRWKPAWPTTVEVAVRAAAIRIVVGAGVVIDVGQAGEGGA